MDAEGKIDADDLDENLDIGGNIDAGNDNDKKKKKSFGLFRRCLYIRLRYFFSENKNNYKS